MERVHQVILNILVTKDIDSKLFNHKFLWGKTPEYIALTIKASYYSNIVDPPGQAVFGRDI